jgi:hypothetical protein
VGGSGVEVAQLARTVNWFLVRVYGSRSADDTVDPKALRGLPAYIPLKILKPKLQRDRVQERHDRVIELEKVWLRKQKLAATKVRQYRQRRRYYEKQLAARKEHA